MAGLLFESRPRPSWPAVAGGKIFESDAAVEARVARAMTSPCRRRPHATRLHKVPSARPDEWRRWQRPDDRERPRLARSRRSGLDSDLNSRSPPHASLKARPIVRRQGVARREDLLDRAQVADTGPNVPRKSSG